jgi:DNA-binding transcriptional regulator YiaG
MERSAQEIASELEIAVNRRNKKEASDLIREFRQSLPSPLSNKADFCHAVQTNRVTLERWEAGKSLPHRNSLNSILQLITPNYRPASPWGEATFSIEDLKYLIEIVKGLEGPVPVSTAITLVSLRKKS